MFLKLKMLFYYLKLLFHVKTNVFIFISIGKLRDVKRKQVIFFSNNSYCSLFFYTIEYKTFGRGTKRIIEKQG